MDNKEWIRNATVYEVNLRQYSVDGNFASFQLHLPRLRNMGVDVLWFMPITPISILNRKGSMGSYYACSDYVSINPEFGGLDDFKNLVRQAHDLGFKVIIDWVANHTGWDHKWTQLHPEWYEKDETGNFKKASGMDDIIELNFNNPDMRREMILCMEYWVRECNIDGFRCDLAFWVELFFWQEAIPELNKIKSLFWLAELDPIDHPDYMTLFDAAYTWTWMHQTEAFCRNQLSFNELMQTLERYEKTPGIKTWFTSNHDENTWNGTEYEKYNGMAKTLAVFSCTWNGIPLIYSGQELPNLKRLAFFEKDAIQWTGEYELHDFYKKLLDLHHNYDALNVNVPIDLIYIDQEGVLGFKRSKNDKEIIVLLNFTNKNKTLMINNIHGVYKELISDNLIELNSKFQLKEFGFLVYIK